MNYLLAFVKLHILDVETINLCFFLNGYFHVYQPLRYVSNHIYVANWQYMLCCLCCILLYSHQIR
jgi:hypothetical protein